ncbi:hypothetical protein ATN89_17585 [Comamonas thiooxydans]|nr:hypothetical protein ATN89_17585 [Comamonas thiooxydans]
MTVIKYDDDGVMYRTNGTTGHMPSAPRAGFVFQTEALELMQASAARKPWARWADDEARAPQAPTMPPQGGTMTRAQFKALQRARAAL